MKDLERSQREVLLEEAQQQVDTLWEQGRQLIPVGVDAGRQRLIHMHACTCCIERYARGGSRAASSYRWVPAAGVERRRITCTCCAEWYAR